MATTAPPPSVSPLSPPPAAENLQVPTTAVELDGHPITPQPAQAQAEDPEERARAHAAKEGDPAVLVDIPRSPAPQDYEVAEHKIEGGGDAGARSGGGEVREEGQEERA